MRARSIITAMSHVLSIAFVSGCYEDTGGQQSQTPAPAVGQQPGPLTNAGHSGGGSALGAAKRSATNVVDRAEQKSREVADQADDALQDE